MSDILDWLSGDAGVRVACERRGCAETWNRNEERKGKRFCSSRCSQLTRRAPKQRESKRCNNPECRKDIKNPLMSSQRYCNEKCRRRADYLRSRGARLKWQKAHYERTRNERLDYERSKRLASPTHTRRVEKAKRVNARTRAERWVDKNWGYLWEDAASLMVSSTTEGAPRHD